MAAEVVKAVICSVNFFSTGWRVIYKDGKPYIPREPIAYPKKECKSKSQCKSSEICHDTIRIQECIVSQRKSVPVKVIVHSLLYETQRCLKTDGFWVIGDSKKVLE